MFRWTEGEKTEDWYFARDRLVRYDDQTVRGWIREVYNPVRLEKAADLRFIADCKSGTMAITSQLVYGPDDDDTHPNGRYLVEEHYHNLKMTAPPKDSRYSHVLEKACFDRSIP